MAWRNALSKTLQELRVHLDQAAPASQGAREFLVANYAELKKANPHFPILVRESSGVEAKLVARYDFGVEKAVSIQGDNATSIATKLQVAIVGAHDSTSLEAASLSFMRETGQLGRDLIKAGEKLPKSGE